MAENDFEWSSGRPRGVARATRRFEWQGYAVTQWRGWRLEGIDRTLDQLANLEGNLYENTTLDRVLWHTMSAEDQHQQRVVANRMKARRNAELMRLNSRKQIEVWRARARIEWESYCRQHRQAWPGYEPAGFDRWSKTQLKAWKADPAAVLAKPNTRSYREVRKAFNAARDAEFKKHSERRQHKVRGR